MEVDFDRHGVLLMEEVDVLFTAIRLTVIAHGSASQAGIDLVAAETGKFCPISKLCEQAGTDLTVTWRKAVKRRRKGGMHKIARLARHVALTVALAVFVVPAMAAETIKAVVIDG